MLLDFILFSVRVKFINLYVYDICMNIITDYIGSAEGLTERIKNDEPISLKNSIVPMVVIAGVTIPLAIWLSSENAHYISRLTEGVRDLAYWLLSDPPIYK